MIYMWNLNRGTNAPIYRTETDSDMENKRVPVSWEREVEGREWKCGVSKYKLLYIEWINNKALLI